MLRHVDDARSTWAKRPCPQSERSNRSLLREQLETAAGKGCTCKGSPCNGSLCTGRKKCRQQGNFGTLPQNDEEKTPVAIVWKPFARDEGWGTYTVKTTPPIFTKKNFLRARERGFSFAHVFSSGAFGRKSCTSPPCRVVSCRVAMRWLVGSVAGRARVIIVKSNLRFSGGSSRSTNSRYTYARRACVDGAML